MAAFGLRSDVLKWNCNWNCLEISELLRVASVFLDLELVDTVSVGFRASSLIYLGRGTSILKFLRFVDCEFRCLVCLNLYGPVF